MDLSFQLLYRYGRPRTLRELENPESVYPMLVSDFLPQWLALLALIAILAATTTTGNSLILTISSIVANEYYAPLAARRLGVKAKVDDRSRTNVTRGLLPVVVGAALALTFFGPPSIIWLIVDITLPALFMTVPTILAGLYWKRVTAVGAMASMVSGVVLLIAVWSGWIPVNLGAWHPGVVIGAIAALVLALVSLATSPVPSRHIERHFGLFDSVERAEAR